MVRGDEGGRRRKRRERTRRGRRGDEEQTGNYKNHLQRFGDKVTGLYCIRMDAYHRSHGDIVNIYVYV